MPSCHSPRGNSSATPSPRTAAATHGSHTAAMLQPFTDAPNDTGLFVNTPEHLYEWTSGADKAGLQVIVHAIGDKAIRTQLDIYQRVERENGARDRRFRIEHLQHIAPADI